MTPVESGPPDLVVRLRAAGCVYAEDEAALLVSAAAGPAELEALVRRRVAGEPLEVVVGYADFCGLRVGVDAGVFVPRGRSALLVAEASAGCRPGSVVVDLCCGSGAVGLAVLAAVPGVELHAADLDPAAVRCARGNLAGRGEVHEGDLYAALPLALRGCVDVLVVNAPYVPSGAIALMPPEARLHEPRAALDGGPDGLAVQRRVAAGSGEWLAPGGLLLVETSERQAPASLRLLLDQGLSARVVRSEDLDATVVRGRRAGDGDGARRAG